MSLGRSVGLTDTGRRRRRNEDSYVCEPPLFAIADGMGGAQAGEVASRLAAAVLEEANGNDLSEAHLAELIQEANRRVFRRSNEDAAASGMGTTMTVALVDGSAEAVAIGHVGDSRAYRVREGELEQLTEDHSLVNELLKSGRLSPEEALSHPQRSVITRAIGTEPDVDVDTFTVDARPGDLFLLCSDGLTDMITDDEILGLVERGEGDLDAAARGLIQAANRSGGGDNITVVAFEIAAAGDAGETQRLPAASTQTAPADDEDTLSGLERVPAIDTAVLSAADIREQIESRPAAEPAVPVVPPPRESRPRRGLLPLLLLLVLLAVIAALVVWGLLR
ncbi:MAG: Stp1/IreP family PP2C-type Ser/Thr phosphatase [Gaiellaceae bacterium MAG52_C11]|nr:Stp1/IreP family PP2C-type Ser/Thr phosphatase [Candidatus Gaiellasilicea maunaloa]